MSFSVWFTSRSLGLDRDVSRSSGNELGYYFEGEEHLIEDGTYAESIMAYFDSKGISWCAWVFDPSWHPQMIKNYDYEPTHQGAFFRKAMQTKNTP